MRPLALVALALFLTVAEAPDADAQIGRLLNRARQAVSNSGGGADPNAPSPATLNGQPAPVLDYSRFMQMRYYPLRGEYYFNEPKNHLIFPPAGLDHYADNNGEYVIREVDGGVVARQRLGNMSTTSSDVFVTLGISGSPESWLRSTRDAAARGWLAVQRIYSVFPPVRGAK